MSREEAKLVYVPVLAAFCQSDIGRRMAESPELHREYPFTVLLAGGDPLPETETGEQILIQGVIDCLSAKMMPGSSSIISRTGWRRQTPSAAAMPSSWRYISGLSNRLRTGPSKKRTFIAYIYNKKSDYKNCKEVFSWEFLMWSALS